MIKITDLNDFRQSVIHKEEIREAEIGEGCTSFCYMISAESTFDTPLLRECRGIVFNTAGNFVSGRPLHKFFNLNEREETRVENLDWSKVIRVMDKRDGSMIHTVWTMNGLRLKSKKSFESDVAKMAEDWMHSQPDLNVFRFCKKMQVLNKTAIFEWTAPDARIVLFYPQAELRLLHVRDNESGEYARPEDLRAWASEFGVAVVDELTLSELLDLGFADPSFLSHSEIQDRIVNLVKRVEGIEGWIVQFENGDMVKIKTEWYLKRHRAMTFIRERDIAQLVIDEGLDDMKSLLVSEGVDISEILKIEQAVVSEINEIRIWVEAVIAADGKMPRKDFALQYQKSHGEFGWFGLLMCRFTGKEPDYKTWYERYCLKEKWSLRQLNLVPSVAEAE